MTAEEKQLLLIDLSARLPYGVKVKVSLPWANDVEFASDIKIRTLNACLLDVVLDNDNPAVKPYLRPMSSMTEEEKKDLLETVVGKEGMEYFQVLEDGSIANTDDEEQDFRNFSIHWINFDVNSTTSYIDWLYSHHFDFRGLLEKGLALQAPEGMYD